MPLILQRLTALLTGLILSAFLVMAGYQARPSYDVQIGGPLDAPLLRGFNTREVTPGNPPILFRWTTDRSEIVLSDIGQQDLEVTLTINGWRPPAVATTTLRVSANDQLVLAVEPVPSPHDYTFPVPREIVSGGALTLTLESGTFVPDADPNPRPLGVVLTRVQVTPGTAPDLLITPSWDVLLSISATGVIIGLALTLLRFGPGMVALGALLPGLFAAWLLVADRLWLTSGGWHRLWVGAALAALAIAALAWGALALLRRFTPLKVSDTHTRLLLTLIFAACLVRLGGQLHPQIFIVDLNFHRNRFETVRGGDLLFTIRSAEWGGRETFYLPTAYLLMLPLYWLLDNTLLALRVFTVAISTLGALPIFAIASRATGNGRAGLIAAALYVILPMAVLPFSWGVTTNLFGEFFLLCALAVAVLAYPRLDPRRPAFWLLLVSLLLALLSHPGVVQLAAVAAGLLAVLWLFAGRREGNWRAGAWVGVALIAAAALSYLLYYRHFLGDMLTTLADIRREREATAGSRPGIGLRIGGSVNDASLGLHQRYAMSRSDWLWGGLRGFWQEAQAYYRVWPIVGAVLGFAGLWRTAGRSTPLSPQKRLALAGAAWGLAALLFLLVGWTLNLYVRYSLFLLPAVALGAGVLMSWVWSRGRLGAALCILVLVFFMVEALVLWHYRISYAFK